MKPLEDDLKAYAYLLHFNGMLLKEKLISNDEYQRITKRLKKKYGIE